MLQRSVSNDMQNRRSIIMQSNTKKLTTGAMIVAIFGLMLLLNRQSAGMFEEFFLYLFPIPMVAYASMYDWKTSLPVLAAMAIFAFFFGNFSTIFYAVTQAFIGLILGTCVHRKKEPTKTMFLVMLLCAITNVLNTIVLAGLFGIDLEKEIVSLQQTLNDVFLSAGVVIPPQLLEHNYLMQMMVISMILLGIIQGLVVYYLSLLVLRRLRFKVPKPMSIFCYFPPKWTGALAAVCYLAYNVILAKPLENRTIQTAIQSAGMCGQVYLLFFGVLAVLLYTRVRTSLPRPLVVILVVITFILPLFSFCYMAVGIGYICGSFHREWMTVPQGKQPVRKESLPQKTSYRAKLEAMKETLPREDTKEEPVKEETIEKQNTED